MAEYHTLGGQLYIHRHQVLTISPIRLAILASVLLHALFLLQMRSTEEFGESPQSHNYRLQIEPELVAQIASTPSATKPTVVKDRIEELANELEAESSLAEPETDLGTKKQSVAEVSNKQGSQSTITMQYIEQLLSQIERHKYYPQMARRRGIEDTITVHFVVNTESDISELQVRGSSTMLENVSRKVVVSALPFPAAPDGVKLPIQIDFQMRFSLN